MGVLDVAASRLSVVDDSGIALKDFFGLAVQVAGHLVDLVFLTAGSAAHAHPATLAMDFKFAGTFLAFHPVSLEKLLTGKNRFECVSCFGESLGPTLLSLNYGGDQTNFETGRLDPLNDF